MLIKEILVNSGWKIKTSFADKRINLGTCLHFSSSGIMNRGHSLCPAVFSHWTASYVVIWGGKFDSQGLSHPARNTRGRRVEPSSPARFRLTALLRCNACARKLTCLQYATRWLWYMHRAIQPALLCNLRAFHSPQKSSSSSAVIPLPPRELHQKKGKCKPSLERTQGDPKI